MVILSTPKRNAITSTGRRNCHADTPAARVTINSWFRVSRQNAAMPPNRTAKRKVCCPMWGSFSNAISSTMAKLTSGRVTDRRNNSMVSNSRISTMKIPNSTTKLTRKWRPM